MGMIELREPRRDLSRRDCRYEQVNYTHAAPFYSSERRTLVHRVRALYQLSAPGMATLRHYQPWFIIDFWCENNGHSSPDVVDDELLHDPGEKLVCARCEAAATRAGEPSCSELAGRHVCTGVCRPINVCCPNENN